MNDDELLELGRSDPSAEVRARLLQARHSQLQRTQALNGAVSGSDIEDVCDAETRRFLRTALVTQRTSARAFHRLLRVARTIATRPGACTPTSNAA